MTEVYLRAPRAGGGALTFSWETAPRTSLYRAEEFTLSGGPVDRVEESLRFRLMLLVLHSQWALLRPCRVHLPFRLPPGEARAWERLVGAEAATLDFLRGAGSDPGPVEIVESGPALARAAAPAGTRLAAAFSGGKDSLVQAGILAEARGRVLLVATTSPMPGLHDHQTARRRRIFEEIVARLPADLIEVRSGFREDLDHGFAQALGYPISVNELTDTFLYAAALVAAGVPLGASHFFLASENEVQDNADADGRIVQHPHFMYSAATLRALEGLLGVPISSATSPLHSYQVQALLVSRYRRLAGLQYSCWRVGPDEAACSRCPQCLRIALTSLAAGGNPSDAGVDPLVLFPAMADWRPNRSASSAMPSGRVTRRLHDATVWSLRAAGPARTARWIFGAAPGGARSKAAWRALRAYGRLWRALRDDPAAPPPGFRGGYLALVDEAIRPRAEAVLREAFRDERDAESDAALARTRALSDWILEPIDARG